MTGDRVELEHPVVVGGETISTLAMRRPKCATSATRGGWQARTTETARSSCSPTSARSRRRCSTSWIWRTTAGCRRRTWVFPAGVPGGDAVRRAAARVAHVLHTPMTALADATVDEVMEWAEDADALWRETYAAR